MKRGALQGLSHPGTEVRKPYLLALDGVPRYGAQFLLTWVVMKLQTKK